MPAAISAVDAWVNRSPPVSFIDDRHTGVLAEGHQFGVVAPSGRHQQQQTCFVQDGDLVVLAKLRALDHMLKGDVQLLGDYPGTQSPVLAHPCDPRPAASRLQRDLPERRRALHLRGAPAAPSKTCCSAALS